MARPCLALLALLAAAAPVQAAAERADPVAGSVSAAVVHRRLVERADAGNRLVTERGELLRLQAAGQSTFGDGGALRIAAAVAGGRLDYGGQTQGGAPLDTGSRHRDLELELQWRPLAAAAWGEAWLTFQVLQQRRRIASTAAAQGLRETSGLLLPGLRWSHAFQAGGWRWEPSVQARLSVRHRVDVDFGGLFDAAGLEGGRRRELALALEAAPAASPWRFGIAWSRARQSASASETLRRAGAAVGTVRQPRTGIDDVTLRVSRAF